MRYSYEVLGKKERDLEDSAYGMIFGYFVCRSAAIERLYLYELLHVFCLNMK